MIDAKSGWKHRVVPHLRIWEMDVWRRVSPNRLLYRIQQRVDNRYLLLKGNWPRKEGEPYDITWPLETTSIAEAQRQADEIIAVDDAKHVPAVANTSHRGEIWHGACDFCGRPALTSGNICRGCDQDIIRKIEDQEAEDGVLRYGDIPL